MPEPKKDVIVYDLEIRNNPETLVPGDPQAGWKLYDQMGISVLVSYHFREKNYRIWTEETLPQFVKAIERCDLRVSFNGYRFDDLVLIGLGHLLDLEPHYDIQHELRIAAGIGPEDHSTAGGMKLTQILYSTLGRDKSKYSGAKALEQWGGIRKNSWAMGEGECPVSRENQAIESIKYAAKLIEGCMDDVKDTADLFMLIANDQPLVSPIHGKLKLPHPSTHFRPTTRVYAPQPSEAFPEAL